MRYKYIDIAKGIGILLVIIAHRCGFPGNTDIYFTACSVPIFFVLGGVCYKSKGGLKEYTLSRWKRLMIPYFKYNFILFSLCLLLGWKNELKQCILAVAGIFYSTYCLYYPISTENNIYFYQVNNEPTWFFTAFFCANILFCFVALQKSKRKTILFLLITIILSKPLGMLPVYLPWNLDKAFVGASLMLLGREMKEKKVFESSWSWKKVFSLCAGGICYYFLVHVNPNINIATSYYGDAEINNVFYLLVIGCIGTYICVEISKLVENICIGKLLECMGRHTMPLLAFHLFVFRVYDLYIGKYILAGKGTYMRALVELFVICGVIVISDCLFTITKKKYMEKKHGK